MNETKKFFVPLKISSLKWISNDTIIGGSYEKNELILFNKDLGEIQQRIQLNANCMDLLIANEIIISALSNGSIFLSNKRQITEKLYHNGPCTTMDYCEQDSTLITSGEDGCINMISLEKQISSVKNADCLPIRCIRLQSKLRSTRFCTSSCNIKLWDTSQNTFKPTMILKSPDTNVLLNSIAVHPNRPDLILSASSDGILTLWDIKKPQLPLGKFKFDGSTIWKIEFLKNNPEIVIGCTESGVLEKWNFDYSKNTSSLELLYNSHTPLNTFDQGFNNCIAFSSDSGQLIFL